MKQGDLLMNRYVTIRDFLSLAPKNVICLIEGIFPFYLYQLEQKELSKKLPYLVSNKQGVFYRNNANVGGLRPTPSTSTVLRVFFAN
jgi:hypothetical protein